MAILDHSWLVRASSDDRQQRAHASLLFAPNKIAVRERV